MGLQPLCFPRNTAIQGVHRRRLAKLLFALPLPPVGENARLSLARPSRPAVGEHHRGEICGSTLPHFLPHAFKVLSLCLLRRIVPHVEAILPDTQAGFRTFRGCRYNVCILAWTVEWLLENSHPSLVT